MAKPKEIYLGPEFQTEVRRTNQYLLSEVVLRRLHRNSDGYSFGKYLRNMVSNDPFDGLDIVIEDDNTIKKVFDDMKFCNTELVGVGEDVHRAARYKTYRITNPKSGTNIEVTFWTGKTYWDQVFMDSDVNSLVRYNNNTVHSLSEETVVVSELVNRIKEKKFNQYFNDKSIKASLTDWVKGKKSVKSNGKEEKTMENVKDMVKTDAIEAGYRVASRQMTKGVKAGILTLMKDKGMDGGKLEAIREVLNTEVGDAIISTLLGYGLTYVPQLKDDARATKLAEEFRITGMATAGNLAIDTTMQYLLPVVTEAMAALPAVEEKVRVEEHNQTSTEECEMEQEEEQEEKQAHA